MLRAVLSCMTIAWLLCWSESVRPVIAVDGTFRLQRLQDDSWRIQLCDMRQVDAVRFDRPVDRFRLSSWSPADAAFELQVDDKGVAELRRKDGEPFSCAAVDVRTWKERPEKNYYAFSPFSDGGMSVYTGYYMPSFLRDGEWQEALLAAEYIGRHGEQVISREPGLLVEQFVYFGRQPIVQTPSLLAVIDPAMPADARQNILDTIPAVNRLLAEQFNFRPASPYMIFMATELDVFDGFSSKGGALLNQVLFTLKGRYVTQHLKKNPKHFPKKTAHEIVHLWQWEHWKESLGQDQPWIPEGGADALAFEVMRLTAIYDEQEYQKAWQDTEVQCADLLRKASIHSGPQNGQFDVVYRCGAVVNRYIGAMLNSEDAGAGTIRFWQAMVAWPEEERRNANEALVFRTLEKLGIDETRINALKEFLDLQTDSPAEALAELRKILAGRVEKA